MLRASDFLAYSPVCGGSKTLSGVRLLPMILDPGIGNPPAAWIKSRYGRRLADAVASNILRSHPWHNNTLFCDDQPYKGGLHSHPLTFVKAPLWLNYCLIPGSPSIQVKRSLSPAGTFSCGRWETFNVLGCCLCQSAEGLTITPGLSPFLEWLLRPTASLLGLF